MITNNLYKITILLLFLFLLPLPGLFPDQLNSGEGSWRTLRTPHFRIHYPEAHRLDALALGKLAEEFHAGSDPRYRGGGELTDVVMIFDNDTVNAYATVFGRDQVVLFVNNPMVGPMGTSGWSNYGYWARELFVHEYTHIQTIRNMDTSFAWIFRIVGGAPPNVATPRGMSEGIAVYEESREGRGRGNDSLTRMVLRTAVLEKSFPRPVEIMNGSHRWPYGTLYYLYGGMLHEYMARQWGEEGIYKYWRHSEHFFYLDSRLNEVGYPDYVKLYRYFKRDAKKRIAEEQEKFQGEERTPFELVTQEPGSRSFLTGDGAGHLYFFANNMHEPAGIYEVSGDANPEVERIRTTASTRGLAATAELKLFSEDYDSYPGFGLQYELFDGNRNPLFGRVFPGRRIMYPVLSQDGKSLFYVERGEHQKSIHFHGEGELSQSKIIYQVPEGGILQQLAVSPDGERLVFHSRKSLEGRGDFTLCQKDPTTESGFACGTLLESDAALIHPSFSPDGKSLYFSSDPEGRFELYSMDLETGTILRRTRGDTGLFYPVEMDGYLYAMRYQTGGYNLVRMDEKDLDQSPFTFPPPRTGDREQWYPENEQDLEPGWKDDDYAGILALRPYLLGFFNAGYTPLESGYNLGFVLTDPLDRHYLVAAVGESNGNPEAFAGYDYNRYSLGFTISYYTNYTSGVRPPPCQYTVEYYVGKQLTNGLINLCEEEDPYQETGSAVAYYSGANRLMSYRFVFGAVHEKLRNAHKLAGIEYSVRDMNRTGPVFSVEVGDAFYFPESVGPEYGWELYFSGAYYPESTTWVSYKEGTRQEATYGSISGGGSLYLPSFFDHHINMFSVYGTATAGRDRSVEQVSQAYLVRGLYYDYAPLGTSGVVGTYEYRLPLYWVSGALSNAFPEIMVHETALSLFAEYGGVTSGRFEKGDFNASYGIGLHIGITPYYIPVPVQLSLIAVRGTGPAAEVQVYVGMSLGSMPAMESHAGEINTRARLFQGSPMRESFQSGGAGSMGIQESRARAAGSRTYTTLGY